MINFLPYNDQTMYLKNKKTYVGDGSFNVDNGRKIQLFPIQNEK